MAQSTKSQLSNRKPRKHIPDKEFAKAYVKEGNNATRAVQSLDPQPAETAKVKGSRLLTKPNVQNEIQKLLNKLEITPETALQPIADGLKANKTAVYNGEVIESSVPDHNTRITAATKALDLLGLNKEQPSLHFHQHIHEQRTKYTI